MSTPFCNASVKGYEETAASFTDEQIEAHMFSHYPLLNDFQRSDPMFRKWRRCLIVECLRRGIIKKDPGPNKKPERR